MSKRALDNAFTVTKYTVIIGFGYLLLNIIRIISENTVDITISLQASFFVISFLNLLVVSKGCIRISECAARFSLDVKPRRLMEIEAKFKDENNSIGMLEKKQELQREADYFDSLDVFAVFVSRANKIIIFVYFPITLFLNILNIFNISEINIVYIKNTIMCGVIMIALVFFIFIYISILTSKLCNISQGR
jgi:flagellar biosynthesis component FlhA